jgi:hypothetical protein
MPSTVAALIVIDQIDFFFERDTRKTVVGRISQYDDYLPGAFAPKPSGQSAA